MTKKEISAKNVILNKKQFSAKIADICADITIGVRDAVSRNVEIVWEDDEQRTYEAYALEPNIALLCSQLLAYGDHELHEVAKIYAWVCSMANNWDDDNSGFQLINSFIPSNNTSISYELTDVGEICKCQIYDSYTTPITSTAEMPSMALFLGFLQAVHRKHNGEPH